MSTITSSRGFTLVETLVATGLLVTALAGAGELLAMSAHWSRRAAASTAAIIAAQGKIEELRAATYSYGAAGEAVTAAALDPSSTRSLGEDIEPNVDWLDSFGQPAADAAHAQWTRRWRVSDMGGGIPEVVAIEVCVFRVSASEAETCLATLRTRHR